MAIPLRLGEPNQPRWTITPRLVRSFSHGIGFSKLGELPEDWDRLVDGFLTHGYIASPPVYEIFDPELLGQFSKESVTSVFAEYLPSLSLELNRSSGSLITDLFVPSQFTASVGRTLRREEDIVSDSMRFSFQSHSQAFNLFGLLGAYSLVSWYRTDEFGGSLDLSLIVEETAGEKWNLTSKLFGLFASGAEGDLFIENSFSMTLGEQLSWSELIKGSFNWISQIADSLTLPILNITVTKGVYLRNQEGLELTISDSGKSFLLRADHRTALVAAGYGDLEGRIALGFSSSGGETEEEPRLLQFGIEGGIVVTLSF